MKLHILRSAPDDLVRLFIRGMSRGGDDVEVPLYQGAVDYDRLVADIFRAELVVCWW